MANAADMAAGKIPDHTPVVGSDGQHFGTVDSVEGEYIKLTKTDPASGGVHRYIPRSLVAGLEGGVVRLSMPAEKAREASIDEAEMQQRLSLDPDAKTQLGQETDGPHGSRAKAQGGKGEREHRSPGAASDPHRPTNYGIENPR
ncbi:DUF2171 domain-containing protein [Roseomonas sp. SSH11]|uniref:DUF2171 domain-containing protein n=1 Tax=Pararoseomonas baculiformis TaxID=2820812 RepID=A0ABS4AGJ3_9PROT|nr:DUF2171 domain-containing protein [Pararoseomonas baculiformis]MBP0445984.1 DUF2171 domain-containing protein [Pararoseomonas baculiformis]